MTSHDLPLGRAVDYPRFYDPGLLFPIARSVGRTAIALAAYAPLPFAGHDRWHAYELSWLDARGKPVVQTATFTVPADSPHLVESKSLKLYITLRLRKGHFTPERHFGFEGAAWYWHFVDVVWLGLYFLVYWL